MIDAGTVFRVRRALLDGGYLDRWADVLGVGDLLEQVRVEARAD